MTDPVHEGESTPSARKRFAPRTPSTWVHSMIRAYVAQKVKARTGKSWDDFEASGFRDQIYRDAVNKVCMDAFYQIRSRKDQRDFVNYWATTICSVPQFIHDDEFAGVASILLDNKPADATNWEDVRSLALLALSAHSQADVRSDTDPTEES